MSLSPHNNINNLRVYPKPVFLLCRSGLIHFLGGAAQTRSSVSGQYTRFPFRSYRRYYQSRSARSSQCIPLTIFHSATREPRPWHSPSRWLAGRLESLFSLPESHVDDACLQTSAKSHGNGPRFTVNYLILTQLPDVVPKAHPVAAFVFVWVFLLLLFCFINDGIKTNKQKKNNTDNTYPAIACLYRILYNISLFAFVIPEIKVQYCWDNASMKRRLILTSCCSLW